MKRVLVPILFVLAAAAPPPGAAWSAHHVRIHRGMQPGAGRWHRWLERRPYGGGAAWAGYGYSAGGDRDAPPRPSGAGFFEQGNIRMQGHRVVYDYDRGYPYDRYRAPWPDRGPDWE